MDIQAMSGFKGRYAWVVRISPENLLSEGKPRYRSNNRGRYLPTIDQLFETLVDDRERVTRELVAFAGLLWDDACLAYERNPRAVRTASNIQVREPIYRSSMARWRNYEDHIAALRDALDM